MRPQNIQFGGGVDSGEFNPAVLAVVLRLDALRLSAATAAIVGFAALAVDVLPELAYGARMLATIKIAVAGIAALVAAYPALYVTGAISGPEMRSVLGVFRRAGGVSVSPTE